LFPLKSLALAENIGTFWQHWAKNAEERVEQQKDQMDFESKLSMRNLVRRRSSGKNVFVV
jgi:hypothetical protein